MVTIDREHHLPAATRRFRPFWGSLFWRTARMHDAAALPMPGMVAKEPSTIAKALNEFAHNVVAMATRAKRELEEDLAGGGDGVAMDGKRVRIPIWVFAALMAAAVAWGHQQAQISYLERDFDAHVSADGRWKDTELAYTQSLIAAMTRAGIAVPPRPAK
jgi:hypothetical protein